MNIFDYLDAIDDVALWNYVARNGNHDFTSDAIKRQATYVEEEIVKETIPAIKNWDAVAYVDGLCDVFVTASYKQYMYTHGTYCNDLKNAIISSNCPSKAECFDGDYLKFFENFAESNSSGKKLDKELIGLYHIMNDHDNISKSDTMILALKEVLDSNWSKFPSINFYNRTRLVEDVTPNSPEAECRWIEKNRNKQNVSYLKVKTSKGEFYVFRDDHGKGKIMKPYCFREPRLKQILSNILL